MDLHACDAEAGIGSAESAGSLSGGASEQPSVESEKGSLEQTEQTEAEKVGERIHYLVESPGR